MRLQESEEALNAIRNGEVDAIIVSGQTGEKVFTLSSAETPYRIIIEEMSEGAVIINSDGTILYFNQRFAEIFNNPVTSINILNFVSENEKPRLLNLLTRGLNERITSVIPFIDPQNNCTFLNFSLRPLPEQIEGDICIIISDITRMQEYQNNLHKLVEERTHELQNANEKLNELVATKTKFFNIIAHDLTNPFTGLIGASEMLFDNVDSFGREQIKSIASLLRESSKSGYSILHNLLDWSRSQTGQLKVKNEKIQLRKLIDDQIHEVLPGSTNKEIEIRTQIDDKDFIITDRNILNTILRNLLNNAIKFTPRKGLVVISAASDGMNYMISVKDNGIGISEENIEKIFKLDTMHTRTGTENEKGTGLGLKLCQEFVERLNGNLTVRSQENMGSEFVVSIPVLES